MISDDRVKRILEQIRKRPANYEYFFSQLSGAEWLQPLRNAGLFSTPPDVLREKGAISFPSWAASRFLERVAKESPTEVLDIILATPTTDNVRVHEDFVKAALGMPADLAAHIAKRQADWVGKQQYLYFLLPEYLAELVTHLASGGQERVAFELAAALLRLTTEDKSGDSSALFTARELKRVVEAMIPALGQRDAKRTLRMLGDLLEQACGKDDQKYSYLWRPAIEDHDQNHRDHEIRDVVLVAIRDSSLEMAKVSPEAASATLDELSRRDGLLFRRLALHLLAMHLDSLKKQAFQALLDPAHFGEVGVLHEYANLVRTVVPRLNKGELEQFAGLLEKGPAEVEGADDSEARHWQARVIAMLGDDAPEDFRERFPEAAEAARRMEHPDLAVYSGTWVGPTTPKSTEELNQLSPAEIASYLKEWRSSGEWNAPTPEGLGRALVGAVSARPDLFSGALNLFTPCNQTYARAIAQGFREAAEKGEKFQWSDVLRYCEWIVSNPPAPEGKAEIANRVDGDPHWGWAKKAVADLLQQAFQRDRLTFELRGAAWAALKPITDDPDPLPERNAEGGMDWASLSINTTRGEAMHAVIAYALWVHRRLKKQGDEALSFDSMPEVRDVLEAHLDLSRDSSPAIRVVYGQYFPWLLLIDREWAKKRVATIFPRDNQATTLREAAWDAYIVFCKPYNDVLPVLEDEYRYEIERLPRAANETHGVGDPIERLGAHLAVFLGRGLIEGDTDSLAMQFFAKAGDEATGETLTFIGRSLSARDAQDAPKVIARYQGLWGNLVGQFRQHPTQHKKALRAFGWWFASLAFDFAWASAQLQEVMRLIDDVEADYAIVEALEKKVLEHPLMVVRLLRGLVRNDARGWNVQGWKDELRSILEKALSSDLESSAEARNLLHELGARGFTDFRPLADKPVPPEQKT